MALFGSQPQTTLEVTGMHCPKCVARVTEALEAADGVTRVSVSLEQENALVEGRGLNPEALATVVNDLGFQATLA